MSSTGRKITLKISGGETFVVDEEVAVPSLLIKSVIENTGANDCIPLLNVTGKILLMVIEFLKKYVEASKSDDRVTSVDDQLKAWLAALVKGDRATLIGLFQAADFMNIESLLDLTWQTLKTFNFEFDDVLTMRKITLKSSDGETFEVYKAVALEFEVIKGMSDLGCAGQVIPLLEVTSKILSKVIEYCNKHVEGPKSDNRVTSVDNELEAWDAEFVKVDQATLFDLFLAANYLNIKGLLDLTSQTVADMIKGKTPEEIRKTFNIRNDLTPEEEDQWAFE